MTVQEFLQQEAERVIQQVCSEHLVGKKDLLGKSTSPHFVRARRAVIRLLTKSGFNKRQMADALRCHITTIYYWTLPASREQSRKSMRKYYHTVVRPLRDPEMRT